MHNTVSCTHMHTHMYTHTCVHTCMHTLKTHTHITSVITITRITIAIQSTITAASIASWSVYTRLYTSTIVCGTLICICKIIVNLIWKARLQQKKILCMVCITITSMSITIQYISCSTNAFIATNSVGTKLCTSLPSTHQCLHVSKVCTEYMMLNQVSSHTLTITHVSICCQHMARVTCAVVTAISINAGMLTVNIIALSDV